MSSVYQRMSVWFESQLSLQFVRSLQTMLEGVYPDFTFEVVGISRGYQLYVYGPSGEQMTQLHREVAMYRAGWTDAKGVKTGL